MQTGESPTLAAPSSKQHGRDADAHWLCSYALLQKAWRCIMTDSERGDSRVLSCLCKHTLVNTVQGMNSVLPLLPNAEIQKWSWINSIISQMKPKMVCCTGSNMSKCSDHEPTGRKPKEDLLGTSSATSILSKQSLTKRNPLPYKNVWIFFLARVFSNSTSLFSILWTWVNCRCTCIMNWIAQITFIIYETCLFCCKPQNKHGIISHRFAKAPVPVTGLCGQIKLCLCTYDLWT